VTGRLRSPPRLVHSAVVLPPWPCAAAEVPVALAPSCTITPVTLTDVPIIALPIGFSVPESRTERPCDLTGGKEATDKTTHRQPTDLLAHLPNCQFTHSPAHQSTDLSIHRDTKHKEELK
jgi:hypothetical protein